MADSLNYQRLAHSRRQEEPGKGRQSQRDLYLRRLLGTLIAILVLILVGELVYHLAVSPRLELRRIQIDSDLDLSVEEITRIGGVREGDLFHRIREAEIRQRLEALPQVRQAHVERIFPDGLGIRLDGRKEVAIVMLATGQGGMLPALVDDEGVIFRTGSEIRNWDLPLVQGLSGEGLGKGDALDARLFAMVSELALLAQENPDIIRAFSEFRIDEVYPGVYEWLLVPIHKPVRIRTSPGLDRNHSLYILKILDVVSRQGLEGIREIDFRTGDVVYSRERGEDGEQ